MLSPSSIPKWQTLFVSVADQGYALLALPRLICLLLALLVVLFWVPHHFVSPATVDPFFWRLLVSAAGVVAVGLTYRAKADTVARLMIGYAYLIAAFAIILCVRNGYRPDYLGVLVVMLVTMAFLLPQVTQWEWAGVVFASINIVLAASGYTLSHGLFVGPSTVVTVLGSVLLAVTLTLAVSLPEQQRFRRTEQETSLLFTLSQDLLCLAGTDGFFRKINPAFEKTLGYTAADLLAVPFIEFVHPEDRAATLAEVATLAAGEPTIYFENRYRCKDGSYCWLAWTATPGSDGTLYAVARNVTLLKQAECELRLTQERFERAIEGTSDGLWDGRLDTYETWYSARFKDLIGLGPAEPLDGHRFMERVHPEDRDRVREAIRRHLESEEPYDCEFRARHQDGRYRWFRGCGKTYPDEDGGGLFMRMAGSMQDITLQKAVEAEMERRIEARTAELEETIRELDAFAYSVSHDLRSPLRAIDGFSQVLMDYHGADLSEEARHYLERVCHNAQHMAMLIDDLLAFSRLSRLPLTETTLDLHKIVDDVFADLMEGHKGKAVKLSVADLPLCRGDARLLRHVVYNLLGNALKYSRTRDPAEIRVGAARRDGNLVYYVADNGVGFDMQYAPKLFEVFQRLHRDAEFEGTGVGLAIVQRIIARHGGAIWAEAEPDQGATFYFTLSSPHEHGTEHR